MIDIITNKEKWDAILKIVDIYDFYHTYDYHQISKKEDEKPVLIKYYEKDKLIAIPFLLRKVTETQFLDITSVYGYAGPLTKNIDDNFDNSNFINEFNEYLKNNHIISVFSRLNPFIPFQKICLKNIGKISSLSPVVNIDISKDLEIQKKAYHKRLRTHVSKSRKLCNVKFAETQEEILAYIDLYYKSMERVNANKYYFFDEKYFKNLLNSKDFNSRILIAIDKKSNRIIAGAIFITTNHIVQYHLSGRDEDFQKHYPNKLIIDEMRLIATKENNYFFNLGGGVANKEDSLFHFKAGFSNDFKDFNIWNLIGNQKIYDQLALAKGVDMKTNYFPLYRFEPI